MSDERERREIAELRERARRARTIARYLSDKEAANGLLRDAEELEARATALEGEPAADPIAPDEPLPARPVTPN